MPSITGPGAFDPLLGKMRTKDVSGGTASGDYTFNTAEFTVGVAGLVSLNQVPASKLDTVSDIVNVTGSSVTLQPNTAYKIYATSQAITLNANPPAAGKWAYDGHLEIFTAGTGYVVTGANVVLANALEPDAVNNCTVRFHDGIAIISVEDHVAGYIVVSATGTTSGSLPYGISSASQEYIAFDATTNGSVIDLSGSTASGEKHIVGNGYTSTTLTGAVDCGTSKFTVANLALSDVQVTGGVMTLGDAYIPSGSTVAVSGGGLAIEKVTGAGSDSVIDLGGTNMSIPSNTTASASGVIFTGGSGLYGGVFQAKTNVKLTLLNCGFIGNSVTSNGGCINLASAGVSADLIDCYAHDNSAAVGGCLGLASGTFMTLSNSVISGNSGNGKDAYINGVLSLVGGATVGNTRLGATGVMQFEKQNKVDSVFFSGSVLVSSGAVVDLTGNTNATPIAPGGGITFEEGGATVKVDNGGSASASSYMLDNVILPAGAKLTNTNVVDLGGTHVTVPSSMTAIASGCAFSGGLASRGGGFRVDGTSAVLNLTSCSVTGNTATVQGGGIIVERNDQQVNLTGCFISGNKRNAEPHDIRAIGGTIQVIGGTYGIITASSGANFIISGQCLIESLTGGAVTISSGASINLTSSIALGGGIIVETGGCMVNGVDVTGGTYTSIVSSGGSAVVNE